MRNRAIGALLFGIGLLAGPVPARATTQAEEAAMAIGATWVNIFYVPAKLAVAIGSIPVGGIAGLFAGGDMRTAYGIWVPAMGGTYFITNGHLDGSKQVDFFGADYADSVTPGREYERGLIYDAPYREMYAPTEPAPAPEDADPDPYRPVR
jgi:hypothetical protein